MTLVLDTSAILAVLFGESGGERVVDRAENALIGAVNESEIVTKLLERGATTSDARGRLKSFGYDVASFDSNLAYRAAELREPTRKQGLSLGDRACLALALRENAKVLTADRAWASIDVGVEIEVIR